MPDEAAKRDAEYLDLHHPDPNYKWGTDYGKDLLKDINQLAHAAGTGSLHRDVLQRSYREIRRLTRLNQQEGKET